MDRPVARPQQAFAGEAGVDVDQPAPGGSNLAWGVIWIAAALYCAAIAGALSVLLGDYAAEPVRDSLQPSLNPRQEEHHGYR